MKSTRVKHHDDDILSKVKEAFREKLLGAEMKTVEEIAEEYSNRFEDGSAKFRYKAFLVGHEAGANSRQAEIDELKSEIASLETLLDQARTME